MGSRQVRFEGFITLRPIGGVQEPKIGLTHVSWIHVAELQKRPRGYLLELDDLNMLGLREQVGSRGRSFGFKGYPRRKCWESGETSHQF